MTPNLSECPVFDTTYHPCAYPFVSLPNTTSACSSTYADAQKDAYDAARILFFALGAPVLGRYIYLLWRNCRHHGGSCLAFGATDKVAVCGRGLARGGVIWIGASGGWVQL